MVDNPGPLLFVHAHPDDKTLATGGTIARYSRAGHDVAIVTCTAGEQGTVPDGEFDQLMNDRDGTLAAARAAEAEAACVLLDAEHRWLGGLFTYRDSGRLGSHANAHPGHSGPPTSTRPLWRWQTRSSRSARMRS